VIFAASAVRREFEVMTGTRLSREQEGFRFWLFRQVHPLGRTLPRVETFEGYAGDEARFGGRISLRVWQEDRPDEGVRDDGLEQYEVERGPQAGTLTLSAAAHRANVEVMFWPETPEPTAETQAAWRKLTEFLHHL
jgi:hypothetical protein